MNNYIELELKSINCNIEKLYKLTKSNHIQKLLKDNGIPGTIYNSNMEVSGAFILNNKNITHRITNIYLIDNKIICTVKILDNNMDNIESMRLVPIIIKCNDILELIRIDIGLKQ